MTGVITGDCHDLLARREARGTSLAMTVIALLLFFSFTRANALTLQLKRVAKINNENIRVIDIVESYSGNDDDFLKIKAITVDTLPFEKRMLNIPSSLVLTKIKQQHPNLEVSIPNTVTAIRWEELLLNEETIKTAAKAYLQKEYSLSNNAEITYANMPRVVIPHERVNISFEVNRSTESSNYLRLVGTVKHNNKIVNMFNLLAQVEIEQLAYQANRSIKKGETLSPLDFTEITVTVNPIRDTIYGVSTGDLVAKKFISKGSILKNTDIITAPFVQINETVNVIVQSPSVQLSYQALSRANGWLGDRVMLQNPDSKQIFYAKVVDKNKVLINLED
jgi:flagella basal body P-ring formation protein FlgA